MAVTSIRNINQMIQVYIRIENTLARINFGPSWHVPLPDVFLRLVIKHRVKAIGIVDKC